MGKPIRFFFPQTLSKFLFFPALKKYFCFSVIQDE